MNGSNRVFNRKGDLPECGVFNLKWKLAGWGISHKSKVGKEKMYKNQRLFDYVAYYDLWNWPINIQLLEELKKKIFITFNCNLIYLIKSKAMYTYEKAKHLSSHSILSYFAPNLEIFNFKLGQREEHWQTI